jgi:hypothetical protein
MQRAYATSLDAQSAVIYSIAQFCYVFPVTCKRAINQFRLGAPLVLYSTGSLLASTRVIPVAL